MDLNEIDLGENTERVREVLSLVWAGQLFRAALPLDSDLIVVRDLEIAHEYAMTKTCGHDELTWSNVVSERMSKVRELLFDATERLKLEDQLHALGRRVYKEVERQLSHSYPDAFEFIASDLRACIYSRTMEGKGNPFFERVLRAYQSGSWPCGWEGHWPHGKLVVFLPA